MSTTIEGINNAANVNFGTGSSKLSVAEMAAVLFLHRSEVMNDIASSRTTEAQARLAALKDANAMKAKGMELKDEAKDNKKSHMPTDLCAWCDRNGVEFQHKSDDKGMHTPEEWDINIENLDNYIQNLSSNNDLEMIHLKSWINKAEQAVQAGDNMWNKVAQTTSSIVANLGR